VANAAVKAFERIATVTGRYSAYETDIKEFPATYFTEAQVRACVINELPVLKQHWPQDVPKPVMLTMSRKEQAYSTAH